jgi:very-short-patch-repair endonuclease
VGYPQIFVDGWTAASRLPIVAAVSLYRDAKLFPETLSGHTLVARTADLARHGVTPEAASWRVSRGRMAKPYHGVYLFGTTPPDLLDRVRAAMEVSPPRAMVGYFTAAALQGFGVVPADRIHLVVPAGSPFSQRRGIACHQSVVPVTDPVVVLGVLCTPPARTAIDLARTLRRHEALAVYDAAIANGALDKDALTRESYLHSGLKGSRRAQELIQLADGRSQCAQESHLRLIVHDGGLLDFVPQVPVPDAYGRTRYYIDLGDPRRRVGAEYDGSSHLDRSRLRDDRQRHNDLETLGWRMRYFTDRDIYRRSCEIVRTLRAAQAS